MITSNSRDVFALLADGKACQWSRTFRCPNTEALAKFKPAIIDNGIALVQNSHREVDIFVTITLTNSVLVYSKIGCGPADITGEIIQIINDPNETIQSLHILSYSRKVVQMAVVTERSVCLFDIRYMGVTGRLKGKARAHGVLIQSAAPPGHQACCFEVALMIRHMFPTGINLVGMGDHEGMVRTADNKLYYFRTRWTFYKKPVTVKQASDEPLLIDTPDIEHIREIIYYSRLPFLLMDSGTVRMPSANYGYTSDDLVLAEVIFPRRIRVATVIANNRYIFYITTEGMCYYGHVFGVPTGVTRRRGLRPLCINALQDYFVEYVYVAHRRIFIKYASQGHSRLGTMSLNWLIEAQPMQLIQYFNDRHIVSVTSSADRTYFVTSNGGLHVHIPSLDTPHELLIHEVPFFKQNPLEVENTDS